MNDLDDQLLKLTDAPKRKPGRKETSKKRRKNVEEEEESSDDEFSNMSEFQREMMAAEKYEQQKEEEERSKVIRQTEKQKEKLPSTSTRDMRSSKQVSKKTEKSELLSDLSNRRAKKAAESAKLDSRFKRREEEDEDEDEDYKDDKMDDDERPPTPKHDPKHRYAPMLTVDDMNSVRIDRDSLDKWVNEAYFDELVKGYYVKVGLGVSGGKRVYRVGYIEDVKEDKAKRYKIGKAETNKILVLKYGATAKNFRMEYVSNQSFDKAEVERWISVMNEADEKLPTVDEIREKAKKKKEFFESYRYTNDDVNKILENKKKLKQIHRNLASEKISLENIREAMKDNGENETNPEKYNDVIERLAEVERELEDRNALKANMKFSINDINKRNREVNELKSLMGNEKTDVTHARRKTQPVFVFGKERAKDPEPEVKSEENKKKIRDSLDDLDVSAPIENGQDLSKRLKLPDIDIDINLDVARVLPQKRPNPRPSQPTPAVQTIGNKQMLSVNEYKRRRGLI
eukprot:TRINITY_DN16415_c0_g1_i1.p1 TRINITY_DN16415_c0_g1~~TRINITY_DN16415_c0_g1_i1.p1  ORF type:complete len:557 (+),score=208.22 TRINITY_DN16415_c0_g1_i1:129-1673(+)